jgi:mono/diheme cytochrome c family protein
MKRFTISLVIAVAGLISSACTDHSRPNTELIQDMMEQPAIDAQRIDPATDKTGMRLPPEGTVPQGFEPYKYGFDLAAAEKNLKNPFEGKLTPDILSLGQKKYETFCLVCHGPQGRGDGSVSVNMAPKPANLHQEKLLKVRDGHIFGVITAGYGAMGQYSNQIPDEKSRWAIVNYVRSLQKLSK